MADRSVAAEAKDAVDDAAAFRVVVADDHPRHRRNVTRMLRAADGFRVVGEAEDVDGALAECVRSSPDVLVMADELPGTSGLSGVRRIHALRPDCAIVLLSLRTEAERSEKARDGAVSLCLDKVADPKAIVDALRAMLLERPAPAGRDAAAPVDASDPIRSLLDRLAAGRGDASASSASPAEALLECVRDGERALELAPEDLEALAVDAPRDVTAHRLQLVADALRRRERFDPNLVAMTLLLDQGEQSVGGRWAEAPGKVERLDGVLEARGEPAYMLLGEGGSGKSVVLRRLAVDAAIAALIAPDDAGPAPVPFFVQLGRYGPSAPGDAVPEASDWLDGLWSERYPALPHLWHLAERGQLLLLLDGLNEMRLGSDAEHRSGIASWARLAKRVAAAHPANRLVFSSRSLDTGQHLSTSELRVPLLRLDPLDLARIRDYVERRAPRAWAQLWPTLAGAPEVEVLRRPFYLDLFATQLQGGDAPQIGGAALITAFVRRALEREMGNANPHLTTHPLLAEDDRRRIAAGRWRSPWELPEAGSLVDGLVRLADRMLRAHDRTSFALIWLPEHEALDAVGGALGSAVLGAGRDIDVLARDPASGDVTFRHQILQDYFAARRLTKVPEPELASVEWRAAHVVPGIDEVLDGLDPADTLPPLPSTAWHKALLLATQMADDPAAFLGDVAAANLALAGAIAARPEVRPTLSSAFLDPLRWSLVHRGRDSAADLRDRIACGRAVGDLGDPRFERRSGAYGDYVLPPLIAVPGGVYPIGEDEPIRWEVPGITGESAAHMPRHDVAIQPFRIGQFPVTNAEWARFEAAGGYDDERWWATEDGRRWRQGELAGEGSKANNRLWRQRFVEEPAVFEELVEGGRFSGEEAVARWRRWMTLDDDAFEAALSAQWPPKCETGARFQTDPRLNHSLQPVVGVSWYEAQAYCAWLAAQTALAVRLPTEVEWEVAARGAAASAYAWGDAFDRLKANTLETRVRQTTPVGVFPDGDSAAGASDMCGNVYEWTSSLFGAGDYLKAEPEFAYPYDATDGREAATAAPDVRRVARGGGWSLDRGNNHAAYRLHSMPMDRDYVAGFRVAAPPAPGEARP